MEHKLVYTYLYLRYDGTPYYVGKGSRQRALFDPKHSVNRPTAKDRILLEPHTSDADALEAEKFLIAYYGRLDNDTGILHNHTDGGDGAVNPSPEVRAIISRANVGNKNAVGCGPKMRGNKNSPGWPKGKPRGKKVVNG